MFVILVYDVGVKRVAKVRKTAEKYLRPVQRSVFDGYLTDHNLAKLQEELEERLDPEADAVTIYKQHEFTGEFSRLEIGKRPEMSGSIL